MGPVKRGGGAYAVRGPRHATPCKRAYCSAGKVHAAHTVIIKVHYEQHVARVPRGRVGSVEPRKAAAGAICKTRHPRSRQGAHCSRGNGQGADTVAFTFYYVAYGAAGVQGKVRGILQLRRCADAVGAAPSAASQRGNHARGGDFANAVVPAVCNIQATARFDAAALGAIESRSCTHAIGKASNPRPSKRANQAIGSDAPHAVPSVLAQKQVQ